MFHSCAQINSLFHAMCKGSQIAAPYIKVQWEKYISSSLWYVLSLDESMNSVLQNEPMHVPFHFWNNSKHQAETRYLTHQNFFIFCLILNLNTQTFSQLECFGYSIWEKKKNEFEQLLVIGSCMVFLKMVWL